jgi:hypothetical protein
MMLLAARSAARHRPAHAVMAWQGLQESLKMSTLWLPTVLLLSLMLDPAQACQTHCRNMDAWLPTPLSFTVHSACPHSKGQALQAGPARLATCTNVSTLSCSAGSASTWPMAQHGAGEPCACSALLLHGICQHTVCRNVSTLSAGEPLSCDIFGRKVLRCTAVAWLTSLCATACRSILTCQHHGVHEVQMPAHGPCVTARTA